MLKKHHYLIFLFLVLFGSLLSAQEANSQKELVMERKDLVDALQKISNAVWEIESQKANPTVKELALQYRLDRLENMIANLSQYMGLPSVSYLRGENIVIEHTRNVPAESRNPQLPMNKAGGNVNDDLFKQLSLAQQQLTLLAQNLKNDSLQAQMQNLSEQLHSIRLKTDSTVEKKTIDAPNLRLPTTPELIDSDVVVKNTFANYKVQLFFDTSSARLTNEAQKNLDDIVTLLKRNSAIFATITGNASREGNARYNENLSRKRAQAVYNYLAEAGIGQDRLILKSKGIDNESELLNYGRRVDVVLEP